MKYIVLRDRTEELAVSPTVVKQVGHYVTLHSWYHHEILFSRKVDKRPERMVISYPMLKPKGGKGIFLGVCKGRFHEGQ